MAHCLQLTDVWSTSDVFFRANIENRSDDVPVSSSISLRRSSSMLYFTWCNDPFNQRSRFDDVIARILHCQHCAYKLIQIIPSLLTFDLRQNVYKWRLLFICYQHLVCTEAINEITLLAILWNIWWANCIILYCGCYNLLIPRVFFLPHSHTHTLTPRDDTLKRTPRNPKHFTGWKKKTL